MFINDMEEILIEKGFDGVDLNAFKLCLLLYADDAIMLAPSRESLQDGLNILHDYCDRWKLTVNTDKSKVMIFRKGGRLSKLDKWYYGDEELEIVKEFTYLGIVFSTTGSIQ